MALIRCGNCGASHASAAEVRACFANQPSLPLGQDPFTVRNRDDGPAERTAASGAPRTATALPAPPHGWGGPDALGRCLVVTDAGPVPPPWATTERVVVDRAALADPAPLLARLLAPWTARHRFVFELHVLADPAEPPSVAETGPAWKLGPTYEPLLERLHHLLWANSVDGREPESLRWPWAEQAVALGATAGGPADVVLPDGTPAFIDGGPLAQIPLGHAVLHRVAIEHRSLKPLGPNQTDARLAPDQLAAVCHPGGAARIIAPAGSGKTRVLTERARLLLNGWGLPARAVTLVAFNKRAAQEMVARTADLAGLQVRTLNALGLAILDGRAPFAARAGRHVVIDERAQRRILERLVTLPRRINTDPMAPWLEALSVARLGLADPGDVETEAGGDLDGFAAVYDRYREELRDQGALDFDEQILSCIEVLLAEPATRRAAERCCRVLLVDEFQDLTPAHLLLIRLLGQPDGTTFAVGDDDQTIYGYTGATPDWLIRFGDLFPGAGDHPLEVNYRCPPDVVAAADRLLRRNRRRVAKLIRPAQLGQPEGLRLILKTDPVSSSVAAVTEAIAKGAEPAEIAVLVRVNASLAPIQVALAHAGVPLRPAVDEAYLNRTGVRSALAWLRVATGGGGLRPTDVTETARRPARGRSLKLVEWMAEQSSVNGLFALASRLSNDRDSARVLSYVDQIELLRKLAAHADTAAVLRAVRDDVGLDEAMDALDASAGSLRGASQADDLDALLALAGLHEDPVDFGNWLRDQLSGAVDDPLGVTLATIHAVKGREWPHVILHDVSAGLSPHRLSDDVEEERRVFHVGMTRCSQTVTVVGGLNPSPFLTELVTDAPPLPKKDVGELRTPIVSRGRNRTASVTGTTSNDAPEGPLYDALRAWRSQRAMTDRVPPYVIFHDKTLAAIVASKPRNLRSLSELAGVGATKLERYGDEIIALVEASEDS